LAGGNTFYHNNSFKHFSQLIKMIRWLEKNRGISFILTILIAIEIFYVSSIPGNIVTGKNIWIPRAYHFIVFFLFSFFVFITIKGNKKIKSNYLLIVLIISISYAILDEIHQMFVPFRESSIKDILTNTIGIFSSIILYLYTNIKRKK